MRRYTNTVCLVVMALLIAGIAPAVVHADLADDERELSGDEKSFVNSLRSRASQARAEASRIRGLLGKPKVLDNAWYASIAECTGFGCGLGNAPQNMQDIADMWDEFVCAKLLAINGLMVLPKPETGNIMAVWTWLDHVNGLAEEVEAGIIIVEMALNERIHQIAEGRRAAAEALFTWCFIATAAYGTPAAEEINILRQFRDEFLEANTVGGALVDFYYEFSPPIAEFISEHELLRTVVREGFVDPVVNVVDLTRSWWAE